MTVKILFLKIICSLKLTFFSKVPWQKNFNEEDYVYREIILIFEVDRNDSISSKRDIWMKIKAFIVQRNKNDETGCPILGKPRIAYIPVNWNGYQITKEVQISKLAGMDYMVNTYL